jgi:hypothetical protein
MIKTFTYKKPEGEISERYVWEVHPASDKMLAIDLSEFDEKDRAYYVAALNDIFDVVKEDIKQLGLNSNYRYFKKDRMVG